MATAFEFAIYGTRVLRVERRGFVLGSGAQYHDGGYLYRALSQIARSGRPTRIDAAPEDDGAFVLEARGVRVRFTREAVYVGGAESPASVREAGAALVEWARSVLAPAMN